MKDYQRRKKFFYVAPSFVKDWDYPSRYAIGINLKDARYKGCDSYNFIVNDKKYSISSEKAKSLGEKHYYPIGSLPNLIPLEEFDEVHDES